MPASAARAAFVVKWCYFWSYFERDFRKFHDHEWEVSNISTSKCTWLPIFFLSRRFWHLAETKISAGASRITRPAELNEILQYFTITTHLRSDFFQKKSCAAQPSQLQRDTQGVRMMPASSNFSIGDTVEPLLTHTPRWSPKCMGYQGLWVRRGMLKIDSKNPKKIPKNTENI